VLVAFDGTGPFPQYTYDERGRGGTVGGGTGIPGTFPSFHPSTVQRSPAVRRIRVAGPKRAPTKRFGPALVVDGIVRDGKPRGRMIEDLVACVGRLCWTWWRTSDDRSVVMARTRLPRRLRYGRRLAVAFAGTAMCSFMSPASVVSAHAAGSSAVLYLDGIACSTANLCFAVGGTMDQQPFVERWDGNISRPTVSPAVDGGALSAVSCFSASSCVAVGDTADDPSSAPTALAEHWNGIRWTITRTPKLNGRSTFTGVSCLGATSCFAVGSYTDDNLERTLIERWNGISWKRMPSPNFSPTNPHDSVLNSVSCTTTTNCFAVGSTYDPRYGTNDAYILRWDGATWSVSARQNPTGEQDSLTGVSCATATMCMAVGEDTDAVPMTSLRDQWNGTTWHITATPPSPHGDLLLMAVSCPSSTDCVAVGAGGGGLGPYAERWNGTKWSQISSSLPAGENSITSVSCTRTDNCYAVGTRAIEHWDGQRWSPK
jgi:hypothetical protein